MGKTTTETEIIVIVVFGWLDVVVVWPTTTVGIDGYGRHRQHFRCLRRPAVGLQNLWSSELPYLRWNVMVGDDDDDGSCVRVMRGFSSPPFLITFQRLRRVRTVPERIYSVVGFQVQETE